MQSITAFIRRILPTRFKIFLRVVYTTRNWAEIILVKLGIKKSCRARFRQGFIMPLHSGRYSWEMFMSYVNLFRGRRNVTISENNTIVFPYRGRELRFTTGAFGVNMPVLEVFQDEPYRKYLEEFDIVGRQVVDIGANIGDTAVYFALWGAKHVYAYDPWPGQCRLARVNIKQNGFEGVCDISCAAVGGSSGQFFKDGKSETLFGADPNMHLLLDGTDGSQIPVVTLDEIVRKFDIRRGFIKSDCEGYEYDIFLKASDETLRRFDYILVEYHYGFERLEKRFRDAGFSMKHTDPVHSVWTLSKDRREGGCGYIVARGK